MSEYPTALKLAYIAIISIPIIITIAALIITICSIFFGAEWTYDLPSQPPYTETL